MLILCVNADFVKPRVFSSTYQIALQRAPQRMKGLNNGIMLLMTALSSAIIKTSRSSRRVSQTLTCTPPPSSTSSFLRLLTLHALSSFLQYLAFRRSRVREFPHHNLVLVRLPTLRQRRGQSHRDRNRFKDRGLDRPQESERCRKGLHSQ